MKRGGHWICWDPVQWTASWLLSSLVSSEAQTPYGKGVGTALCVSYILICEVRRRCNYWRRQPCVSRDWGESQSCCGSRQTPSLGSAVAVRFRTGFTGGQFGQGNSRALFCRWVKVFMILCVPLCSFHPVMSRSGFVAHVSMFYP